MRSPMNLNLGKRAFSRDKVYIDRLAVQANIGPDCWNRKVPQNCQVSLELETDFTKASQSDELQYSLNYAVISKDVAQYVDSRKDFRSLGNLSQQLIRYVKEKYKGIERAALTVNAPEAHIRCQNVALTLRAPMDNEKPDRLVISGLKLLTLIGVFTFERLQKQYVTVDIEMPWSAQNGSEIHYQKTIDEVCEYVESSNFKTVEALVECVTQVTMNNPFFEANPDAFVTVKVIKLNAITATKGVGVSCTRMAKDFLGKGPMVVVKALETSKSFDLPVASKTPVIPGKSSTAFLAFGSNVGDRLSNIQYAIDLLAAHPEVEVRQVSSIFESEPMYFQDQRLFLNGCIEVETQLIPRELLELCKQIEYEELKRVKEFDNGPRSIDLDIIFYKNGDGDHIVLTTEDLVIPHPRLLERTFVMEPLCELISHDEVHPVTAEPVFVHLNQVYDQERDADILWKVIPLPQVDGKDRFLKFKNKPKSGITANSDVPVSDTISPTLTMGILNTTPDSFSDGGCFNDNLDLQLSRVKSIVQEVLNLSKQVIIDIGGCSTRPNSKQATLQQEIERTIPLLRAIRACSSLPQSQMVLSIDTYRSEVAQLAIEAGVDVINDISGGKFDPKILSVVAKNPNVAYAMSHIRGSIHNMNEKTNYDEGFESDDVRERCGGLEFPEGKAPLIRVLGRELASQYTTAVGFGVKRWQILLDPGIGFAKHSAQNLEIIRNLGILKNYSMQTNSTFVNFRNIPVLVGPSRKKFIGHITGDTKNASDRDFVTGAVASACVGYGADIVRVHDTANCVKSIKMADALYRSL
ncbi:LADA_0H02784g1_1 [Lachancea dasiensis]|uniref:Folic acid synthesis protein fol1 n=1 Tax=Lachancea dasiensis TaxID=1072105 RepID=A0A1G4JZZ7_9SACH|nr:LADA_0H02784g1_1 [Lachancea dasiensis]